MRLSRRAFVQSTFGVLLLPWMPGRCADWLPAAACPSREELLAAICVKGPFEGPARWKLLFCGHIERHDGEWEMVIAAGSCAGQAEDCSLRWDTIDKDGQWLYRHTAPLVFNAKEKLAEYLETSCRRGWWDMPTPGQENVFDCQPFRRLHVWPASTATITLTKGPNKGTHPWTTTP